VSNINKGVRASVRLRECADVVTCFTECFQDRGRGSIKIYDGKRMLGQYVLMRVLD
jgi:hypothetical protein